MKKFSITSKNFMKKPKNSQKKDSIILHRPQKNRFRRISPKYFVKKPENVENGRKTEFPGNPEKVQKNIWIY